MENSNEFDFLPVGTIIKVNFSDDRYMIVGYLIESDDYVYDYCAAKCPEGFNSFDDLLLFDEDKITGIDSKGYVCDEYDAYIEKLKIDNGLIEENE